jgi:hypothetical protein
MKKNNLKSNIYFIFLVIFSFSIFDVFLNSYIILNSSYQQRMIKYGGFCEYHGYGFVKYINEKYKLDFNIATKNFNDYPPVQGYFYNIKKKINNNYLILINHTENSFASIVKGKKFKILEKIDNCYFIKFND